MSETVTDPRSTRDGDHGWLTNSRVYNLVWLGRWLERFDGIARMLGAIGRSGDDVVGARAFQRSLQSAALAFGVAAAEPDASAEDHIAAFGELMAACLRNARDDATQVGSLELIQELNALLHEFPGVWSSAHEPTGLAEATRYLSGRMHDVTAACEQGWVRPPLPRLQS